MWAKKCVLYMAKYGMHLLQKDSGYLHSTAASTGPFRKAEDVAKVHFHTPNTFNPNMLPRKELYIIPSILLIF